MKQPLVKKIRIRVSESDYLKLTSGKKKNVSYVIRMLIRNYHVDRFDSLSA